jgi:sugar phosphate isomerase/epimerase
MCQTQPYHLAVSHELATVKTIRLASSRRPRSEAGGRAANRAVVAAAEGVARWPELLERLRADGYEGIFSLEPHLVAGGKYGGFSGLERFRYASQAFQGLLRNMGWAYQ